MEVREGVSSLAKMSAVKSMHHSMTEEERERARENRLLQHELYADEDGNMPIPDAEDEDGDKVEIMGANSPISIIHNYGVEKDTQKSDLQERLDKLENEKRFEDPVKQQPIVQPTVEQPKPMSTKAKVATALGAAALAAGLLPAIGLPIASKLGAFDQPPPQPIVVETYVPQVIIRRPDKTDLPS